MAGSSTGLVVCVGRREPYLSRHSRQIQPSRTEHMINGALDIPPPLLSMFGLPDRVAGLTDVIRERHAR